MVRVSAQGRVLMSGRFVCYVRALRVSFALPPMSACKVSGVSLFMLFWACSAGRDTVLAVWHI